MRRAPSPFNESSEAFAFNLPSIANSFVDTSSLRRHSGEYASELRSGALPSSGCSVRIHRLERLQTTGPSLVSRTMFEPGAARE